jgi:uncharacterized transporter YbjL
LNKGTGDIFGILELRKTKSQKESPVGFRLREIDAESKFSRELRMDVIRQVVSTEQVRKVLQEEGVCEQRERKLNMVVTVFIVIGMGLYSHLSIGKVLIQLAAIPNERF